MLLPSRWKQRWRRRGMGVERQRGSVRPAIRQLCTAFFHRTREPPDAILHGDVVSGPRSMHAGGAQVSLCDGSVRFVSENVDRQLFRNVFSRGDGRVIGEY